MPVPVLSDLDRDALNRSGAQFTLESIGSILQTLQIGVNAGGGGGGSSNYPARNTTLIDPTQTPVAGKVFATWALADAYAQGTIPSVSNTWEHIFAGGTFSEALTIRPFTKISGQGNATVLTGNLASDITFAMIADSLLSGFENVTIANFTGTATRISIIRNCLLTGGTAVANSIPVVFSSIVNGTLNLSACLNAPIYYTYFAGGTIGASTTPRNSSFQQNLGNTITINGGSFTACDIQSATIVDGFAYVFRNCFILDSVTIPEITSGTWAMIATSCNTPKTIEHNGNFTAIEGCTNIVLNDLSEPAPDNRLSEYKVKNYVVFIDYSELSAAALSNTIIIKNSIPPTARVMNVLVVPEIQFDSVGDIVTALTADVGISGSPSEFVNAFDILSAPSSTNFVDTAYNSLVLNNIGTALRLKVDSVGANLDQLTAGQLKVAMTYVEFL